MVGPLLIILAVLAPLSATAQSIIHVDRDAAGANDGASWPNAFVHLQDALAVAAAGDEVWVAEGVYHPDEGADLARGQRDLSFRITVPIRLYGGFSGTESRLDQRDSTSLTTILSGDLLGNDPSEFDPLDERRADNAGTVLEITAGSDQATVVDGFQILGGQEVGPAGRGGGILIAALSAVALINLRIANNFARSSGGGISSRGTFALLNSVVEQNTSGTQYPHGSGGGIHLTWDSESGLEGVRLDGVSVRDNTTQDCGGGLFAAVGTREDRDNPVLVVANSSFRRNTAVALGGGICLQGGLRIRTKVAFQGLTMVQNMAIGANTSTGAFGSAEGAGGMWVEDIEIEIHNALIADNRVFPGSRAGRGGGIWAHASSMVIGSATFARNQAQEGAAIAISSGELEIDNSIFWMNESEGASIEDPFDSGLSVEARYSLFDSGLPEVVNGEAILEADPAFVDPDGLDGIAGTEDDDFRLGPASLARNAGLNSLLPTDAFDLDGDGDTKELLPVDLAGRARVNVASGEPPVVDLGALEFSPEWERRSNSRCSMEVSPTPAGASAHIRLRIPAGAPSATVSVIDMLGREQASAIVTLDGVGLGRLSLETNSLSSGVYGVIVSNVGGSHPCQSLLVVQH